MTNPGLGVRMSTRAGEQKAGRSSADYLCTYPFHFISRIWFWSKRRPGKQRAVIARDIQEIFILYIRYSKGLSYRYIDSRRKSRRPCYQLTAWYLVQRALLFSERGVAESIRSKEGDGP